MIGSLSVETGARVSSILQESFPFVGYGLHIPDKDDSSAMPLVSSYPEIIPVSVYCRFNAWVLLEEALSSSSLLADLVVTTENVIVGISKVQHLRLNAPRHVSGHTPLRSIPNTNILHYPLYFTTTGLLLAITPY